MDQSEIERLRAEVAKLRVALAHTNAMCRHLEKYDEQLAIENGELRDALKRMDSAAKEAEMNYGSLWKTGAGHWLKPGIDAVRAALAEKPQEQPK